MNMRTNIIYIYVYIHVKRLWPKTPPIVFRWEAYWPSPKWASALIAHGSYILYRVATGLTLCYLRLGTSLYIGYWFVPNFVFLSGPSSSSSCIGSFWLCGGRQWCIIHWLCGSRQPGFSFWLSGSAVADNRGSIQQFSLSCTGRKLLYLQCSFCCVLI